MIRGAALILLLLLAGCSGTPQSLGITGPAAPQEPPMGPDDSTVEAPGLPNGNGYGPTMAPTTGGGRYYNYN